MIDELSSILFLSQNLVIDNFMRSF